MFERFTERARQAVVLAQDEARSLGHNYIGTEHLLLGLLREEQGLAARVLESLNVPLDEVRARVAEIVGIGDEVSSGQMPFTPRAKKVLELSLREALSIGHNYIGTEHILLGLLRENEGVAARIVHGFGVDNEQAREVVIGFISGPNRGAWETRPAGAPTAKPTRWDYRLEPWPAAGGDEGLLLLKTLGERGWELGGVVPSKTGSDLILKRRAQLGDPVTVRVGVTVTQFASALGVPLGRVIQAISTAERPVAVRHELSAAEIELLADELLRRVVIEPAEDD
jgi:ATP-dependent Clp protease ATP-binding subunit ClpA